MAASLFDSQRMVFGSRLILKMFHKHLIYANNFCFEYLASLKPGWPVGKSNFNENTAITLDLGLGLRL